MRIVAVRDLQPDRSTTNYFLTDSHSIAEWPEEKLFIDKESAIAELNRMQKITK